MGMTAIRLPFLYMNLTDDDGNFSENAFARLDWFVENCSKRGMYVILDLHGAYGSQNGLDHSGQQNNEGGQLFNNQENRAKTVRLWEEIARHFKGNPAVAAYDLLNEPIGAGSTEEARTEKLQWDFFDELYKAIRAVDPNHIIMMEACWIPTNLPSPLRYGWENVVYEYHYYAWGLESSTESMTAFNAGALLLPKVISHGVPTYIGEFNCFGDDAAWQDTLQFSNQANFHWTTWTYKTNHNSNWSIYTLNTESADIYSGTEAQIREAWSKIGTENATATHLKQQLEASLQGTA
jgi:aryl-phospho-beta-D-glucosidase BglC (GH1 family)